MPPYSPSIQISPTLLDVLSLMASIIQHTSSEPRLSCTPACYWTMKGKAVQWWYLCHSFTSYQLDFCQHMSWMAIVLPFHSDTPALLYRDCKRLRPNLIQLFTLLVWENTFNDHTALLIWVFYICLEFSFKMNGQPKPFPSLPVLWNLCHCHWKWWEISLIDLWIAVTPSRGSNPSLHYTEFLKN